MAIVGKPHAFMSRLCEVLGIDVSRTPVQRIVIEADARSIVKVYVQGLLNTEQVDPLLAALQDAVQADEVQIVPCKDVTVDEKGEVRHRRQEQG